MNGKETALVQEGLQLANGKWKKYINALTEGYKKTHGGKAPQSNILATTAMMLENTQNYITRMDETTRVVNLGNFIDYGFGVITAIMPALVAHEIVSVQPLKGRSGEIFYLDFKYGSNKGRINAGPSMISPFTGANPDTTFTGEEISGEELETFSDEAGPWDGSLSWTPVTPGSVNLELGNITITDNQAGILEGTGVTGTIDYQSGKITLSWSGNQTATLSASYNFRFGNQDVGAEIPEMNVDLGSKTISTVTRSLRARWLFDAAFELQQVHGINADEEIATAMAAEVRHEIDGEIMKNLRNQAAAGNMTFAWSKQNPPGVSFIDHKDTFTDLLIQMSNAIFQDTKRADGNYVVAGIDVSSLIESMPGRFIPNNDGIKAGPHVIGTLDGRWKIIKNPFYPAREFVVGYKGTSYLEGGYVYAPFLPLYTTPTVMLDDFVNRKGVRTIYGQKMLNPLFYAKGIMVD